MRTLLGVCLLAAPLWAADIVSAYGHIPGGGFRVPVPDSRIPWREMALKTVSLDVERPDAARLRDLYFQKDQFGNAELSFRVPVPTDMEQRRYYAVSDWGLTPLRIRGLVGAARYAFDPQSAAPVLLQVGFTGQLFFDNVPEDDYVEAGFVWASDHPVTSEVEEVEPRAIAVSGSGDTARVTWQDRTASLRSPVTSRAETAALISAEGEKYLYIQWHPEGTSCEYMFTLLRLTATSLEETASTVYGCDY